MATIPPLPKLKLPQHKNVLGINNGIPLPNMSTPAGPRVGTTQPVASPVINQSTPTAQPITPAPNMSTPSGPAVGAVPPAPITSSPAGIQSTGAFVQPPPTTPPTPSGFQTVLAPDDPAAIGGRLDAQRIAGTPTTPIAPPVPTAVSPEAPVTADGKPIDPVTGGVTEPTQAEQAVTEAETAFGESLAQTPEQVDAQARADALAANLGLDIAANRQRTVAMPFITGGEAALQRTASLRGANLEREMARLEAKRISGMNVSKFALERADKKVEAEQKARATEGAGGFTLGAGQKRFDAQGNVIAEGAEAGAGTRATKTIDLGDKIRLIDSATGETVAEYSKDDPDAMKAVQQGESRIYSFTQLVGDPNDPNDNGAIGDIEELFKNNQFLGGFGRAIEAKIAGTGSFDLNRNIDTLKSNLAFDRLQKMRDESPTGGALGQVSDNELRLLSSAVASLDIGQSDELLGKNLAKVRKHYTDLLEKAQRDIATELEVDGVIYQDDGTGNFVPKANGGADTASTSPLSVTLPNGTTHQGGSASWRNNNPLNIKNGSFASNYGAKEGSRATDGGNFAAFPSVQAGIEAATDLLKASSYRNLPLEDAMRRWSGSGYGSDVAPAELRGMTTGQMTDKQIETLIKSMRQREGWKEGTVKA